MKKTKAKNIILVLLAVLCVAVLLYTLYQGLIIYIPQKQEQQRFEELRTIRNLSIQKRKILRYIPIS